MKPRKIVFITNPASGPKTGKPGAGLLKSFFDASDDLLFSETMMAGHGTELAAKAVQMGADAVIAIGGDGTVNEIARSLNGTSCALGIIPCGSGNGLARHHKIPLNLRGAIECIKKFRVINHDAVAINGHLSFNVSGIGFDAHVAHLFGKNGKRGFNSYIKLVLREFRSYGEKEITVSHAGGKINQKVMLAAIANASQFGNNATIAPHADTCDGIADITLIRKMHALVLPVFMMWVFNRKMKNSTYTTLLRGENFRIDCSEPMPLHIDGEPAGYADTYEINILKSTLKLIVP